MSVGTWEANEFCRLKYNKVDTDNYFLGGGGGRGRGRARVVLQHSGKCWLWT